LIEALAASSCCLLLAAVDGWQLLLQLIEDPAAYRKHSSM